jgi:hypothetical protein
MQFGALFPGDVGHLVGPASVVDARLEVRKYVVTNVDGEGLDRHALIVPAARVVTVARRLRRRRAILRAGGAELSDAVMVHTLLLRPEDADGVIEVGGLASRRAKAGRCCPSQIGSDSTDHR